jgi:hypothetical protein
MQIAYFLHHVMLSSVAFLEARDIMCMTSCFNSLIQSVSQMHHGVAEIWSVHAIRIKPTLSLNDGRLEQLSEALGFRLTLMQVIGLQKI